MKKTLLLYASQDGQTLKIMQFIEHCLRDTKACELKDLYKDDIDLKAYDQVVIGGAVRYGHLNKKLYQFIERNANTLTNMPNAFFCVNLTARKEGKDTPETSVYMKTFLKRSVWQPQRLAVFAGALKYPQYKLFDRLMIQLIMKITGGETDPSKEVEYTNWDKVAEFSKELIKN